jgi:hypothetical protein
MKFSASDLIPAGYVDPTLGHEFLVVWCRNHGNLRVFDRVKVLDGGPNMNMILRLKDHHLTPTANKDDQYAMLAPVPSEAVLTEVQQVFPPRV